ncbi:hypothetical protein WJX73_006282 [Symbiochloris irregularis]|uniref:F-box domain-containing protein n=1 Tax=Symbiochloris irregularis TaxID=706552 RepID=A0AAW1NSM6_9CHLO
MQAGFAFLAVVAAALCNSRPPNIVELPEDVWCRILALLEPREVMGQAALVCKDWLRIATSSQLWRLRLPPLLCPMLTSLHSKHSVYLWPRFWATLCVRNLLHYRGWAIDVIKTLPLEPGHWGTVLECASGWLRESPRLEGMSDDVQPAVASTRAKRQARRRSYPIAAVSDESVYLTCSCAWCEVVQVVDLGQELANHGIPGSDADAFLDASPCLHLSLWCGARNDCRSHAAAKLILCGREDLYDILTGGGIHSKLRWSWTGGSHGAPFQQPGSFCWDSGTITLVPDTWTCISADIKGLAGG